MGPQLLSESKRAGRACESKHRHCRMVAEGYRRAQPADKSSWMAAQQQARVNGSWVGEKKHCRRMDTKRR